MQKVLEELRKKADEYMSLPVLSVIYRKAVPPTKNMHEYASLAPYWWPNPDTEDGLPYIRKDGYINPVYFEDMSYEILSDAVYVLALAAYNFNDKSYGDKAEKLLYDWFLNPETYMEPHAEYAQYIPGICNGRGIGIIEFRFGYKLFPAIKMLEEKGFISNETVSGLKEWFVKFANWMMTSENGLDEDIQENNHGTWYDASLLSMAIFTDRKFLAEKICKTAYERRIKEHVTEDGSQPRELARTQGIHYSLFNTHAMVLIGIEAERIGCTEYFTPDKKLGKSIIESTIDYIYPYVLDTKAFPYEEIYPEQVEGEASYLLSVMAKHFDSCKEKASVVVKKPYVWLSDPNL